MPIPKSSWLLLLCLLFAGGWKAEGKCYCRPCGPISGKKGFQFVGFTRSQDPATYTLFDFSKLTTVVILKTNNQTKDFVCYAHARGVKVVLIAYPPTKILWRKALRENFINGIVKTVTDCNLDGVNVDYEKAIYRWINPLSFHGLSSLMKELKAKLNGVNPLYELSMDWVYCPNCHWGRSYDYNVIKNHIDYFVVMFYDMQWAIMKFTNGLCEAQSQSRFDVIQGWANVWAKESDIAKQKLVFAFPWYGHVQRCYEFETPGGVCHTKCGHINKGHLQRCYSTATTKLRRRKALGGRQWSNQTQSPRITWLSGHQYFQMNYDDPESLKLRYDMALQLGVRGVGAWHITCLDSRATAAAGASRIAMWHVIPTGKKVRTG